MKGSIEAFVAIILIALMSVLSVCYISASFNTRQAQNFHSAMVTEIEVSNFSQEVIDACEAKAIANGFIQKDASGNKVSGLKITKMSDLDVAEVKLTYNYSIPFLNIFLEHEIVGYAR